MRSIRIALLVPLLVAIAACSPDQKPSADPGPAGVEQTNHLSASMAYDYPTMRSFLDRKEASIVRVKAGAGKVEVIEGVWSTYTPVTVLQTLHGNAASLAGIRQTGTGKGYLSEILKADQEYLLVAHPWHDQYPGQYYITGDQGLWILDRGLATAQYRYVGADSATLPRTLTVADVESGAILR